ncbi:rolling circle replication-associated protein [Enterococcus sp. LJL128]
MKAGKRMISELFIREKIMQCGNYFEADLIPRTNKADRAVRGKRGKKVKLSKPAQDDLNDKNSARYFTLLANGNFENNKDFWFTGTYTTENMPTTFEQANRQAKNFIRRLKPKYKKVSKELRYILVTEYRFNEETGEQSHFHHHILLSKGIGRDEIEDTWSIGRGKNKQKLGRTHCRVLQFDENGIAGIAHYVNKGRYGQRGRKKWSSSRNLKRPFSKTNDYKYTPTQLTQLALSQNYGIERLEKIYNNYFISEIEPKKFEETGWHIYIRMWKKTAVPWKTTIQKEMIQKNRIKIFEENERRRR